MSDQDKTKEELIIELQELRQKYDASVGFLNKDFTDCKQEQYVLQKSEQIFLNYIEFIPYGVFVVDKNGDYIDVNSAACKITGYNSEELLSMNQIDMFTSASLANSSKSFNEVIKKGFDSEETTFIRKDSSKGVWIINAVKLSDDGFMVFAADISERKHAEKELSESEKRLNRAQRMASIGNWMQDAQSNELIWSDEIFRIFEVDKEFSGELLDIFFSSTHPEDREAVANAYSNALKTKKPYNLTHRLLMSDGRVKHVHEFCETEYNESGNPIKSFGTVQDITKRKNAEKALRISERKLQLIIDTSPIGICTVDPRGNYVTTNLALEQMLGYSKEELRNLSFFDVTHPEDRPNNKNLFQDMMSLKTAGFFIEKRYISKEGTTIEVAIHASGMINVDKKVRFGTAFIYDITERKQAEKERERYVELLETQRVELERFTYTVSHDLKSPIITIKGFLGMLKKDAEEGNMERFHSDINRINVAAIKMGDLLDDLLDLSRIGRLENQLVNVSLDKLAYEVVETLHGPISERGVRMEIEPGMPIVLGDHMRLYEVLQNLIENAIKFMGDQTKPCIIIGSRIDDAETVCYVRDNGEGIDSVYANKIFELFEQLDGHAQGTGIGLALVKRIIEYHNGRVWMESEGLGCGSTFYFSISNKGKL